MPEFRLQSRYIEAIGLEQYRFASVNGWAPGRWWTTVYLAWLDLRRHLKASA